MIVQIICAGMLLRTIPVFAQDPLQQIGGDMTTDFPGRNAIQLPAPNVTDEDRRQLQLSGFAPFHRITSATEGVGPAFVNQSCGGCHVENGKGPARISQDAYTGSSMIIKIGVSGREKDGSTKPFPRLGGELQPHLTNGKTLYHVGLTWLDVPGVYPDGTKYTLRKPKLKFDIGTSPRQILYSLRMTPGIIGPGLIEAIPAEQILERADPRDKNKDGISGKPNMVYNRVTKQKEIGRFGFKAGNPTDIQQSAAALYHDMSVTTSIFNDGNKPVELSDDDLNRLVLYQKLAGVPRVRDQSPPSVIRGRSLFTSIGCESCHRMTFTTGTVADPEVSNQTIHPFTDLLLHNMGPGLADNYPEFSAAGFDWRTQPLWGIGFLPSVSSVRSLYLHDGRARTLEEAILWHGGESNNARKRFMRLKRPDRVALIDFLKSL